MASDLELWHVNNLGFDWGRVVPSVGDPFEGDYVFVLGSERAGFGRMIEVGDRIDVYQSEDPAAGELLRIAARIRGPETMPALSDAEPFALSDGQNLTVVIDEGTPQVVTFVTADFASIGAATALEVARVLNRDLTDCRAYITGADELALFSLETGRRSRVQITGGTATSLNLGELTWRAVLLLDGTEYVGRRIWNGDEHEPLDFAANLAAYSNPLEIRFRLEVVRV